MPAKKRTAGKKAPAARPSRRPSPERKAATKLPVAMTGRASPAKASVGDEPVFAYIRTAWMKPATAIPGFGKG